MKQDIWNEHRARQGPITVYTGADEPFTSFDMERIGKRAPLGKGNTVSDPGFFGRGAYTTTDYNKANRWSYGSGNVMATVIPPDAKFLRITSIDELYNKWGMQKVTKKEQDISSTLRTPEGFPTVESQAAYKKAIDTWTDKMMKEGWDGVELVSKTDREFVLFHPERYEFDPQTGGAPDSPGAASQMRAEGGGELPTSRLVQAYVDGEIVPRTPSGEPPAQLYRIMDRQQYDDAIKEGELKPAPGGDGRIFASGEPRLQFLEEPSRPAVLVAIDYSDADGWRAREASTGAGGAGEVSAATRNSIPASKLKLIAEGVNKAELLRGLQ